MFLCVLVSLFRDASRVLLGRARRLLLPPLAVAGLVGGAAVAHAEPTVDATIEEPSDLHGEPLEVSVLLVPTKRAGVSRALSRTIDQILLAELHDAKLGRVVSTADLAQLIEQERLRDLLACDEVRCLSEIGGAFDSDWLLTSAVRRVAGRLQLSLQILAADDVEILAAIHEGFDDEHGLLATLPRITRQLLREANGADPHGPATFFTAEISASAGTRVGGESYYPGPGGTVRLAWGGLWPPIGWYFYVLAGFQVSHLWGDESGRSGELAFQRTSLAPFGALRVAIPIANDGATRITIGFGVGGVYEDGTVEQEGGVTVNSDLWKPEVRALLGAWHRVTRDFSLFGNYRLRAQFGGKGADAITEVVALGGSESAATLHEFEFGCGFHF